MTRRACFLNHVTTVAIASGSLAQRKGAGGEIVWRSDIRVPALLSTEARLGWADDPDLMEGIKPKGMH